MKSRVLAASCAVVLGSGALAACGSSAGNTAPAATGPDMSIATNYAKTPVATIIAEAKASFQSLQSLTFTGTAPKNGHIISFSVSLDAAGHCNESLSIDKATITILGTPGGHFFMTGDRTGLTAFAQRGGASPGTAKGFAELAAGKWLTGLGDPSGGLCDFASQKRDTLQQFPGQDAKVTGTTMVNGLPAVEVSVRHNGKVGTMTIDASAPHYVLTMTVPSAKSRATFSGFNKPVSAEAPKDAIDVRSMH